MLRKLGDSTGYRTAAIGAVAGLAALALAVDTADARGRKRQASKGGGYNPPSAAIVVDANSGGVLYASDADGIRHPASITKIMTLYLLFEQMEAGRFKTETPLKVSAHAAAQSPTKLGVKAGDTITVEEAIRGLVTKSANDAAVVVAEAIAGDEDEFAKRMTRKARALGMTRTVYMNASGLPDRDQVTTARDQALLGRAIQDRFPRYYRYFSTTSFTFRGKTMSNHNRLLGSVQGVDGIKTGYINASGFNLVASMKRNNRHLVAVVLGGSSAGARDSRMRSLLEQHVSDASARRTIAAIAESQDGEAAPAPTAVAAAAPAAEPASAGREPTPAVPAPAKPIASSAKPNAPAGEAAAPAKGPVDPIKPIAVKTIKVKLTGVQSASLTPPVAPLPIVAVKDSAAAPASVASIAPPAAAKETLSPRPVAVVAAAPVQRGTAAAPVQVASADPGAIVTPAPAPAPSPAPVQTVAPAAAPAPAAVAAVAAPPAPRKAVHTGWVIQVGAFDAEREARDRLSSAQIKAKHLLGRAEAFTEPVVKDNKTFYRARFAGFEKDEAEAACKYLKRNDFACMTLKN